MLLDPGMNLTLRPMRYPHFYERYRDAIKNTWTVEEVDLHSDLKDLQRLTAAERHLVGRLVAFFATGDTIVANNLVLNLYQHINSPEGRLYLSRQLFEEAVHVQFYLTLLDTYVPDEQQRHEAFAAVDNIPSIKHKADFCFTWIDSVFDLDKLETKEHRRAFLLNVICFAACIEGLFFYGAFAYVYFLRSRGLLNGLASGTNWVFRDESMHMAFAFDVVETVRREEPDLFDDELADAGAGDDAGRGRRGGAVRRRTCSAEGWRGCRPTDMRTYLESVADRRLRAARARAGVRLEEPAGVHGAAGRAGAVELLRASRLGLPGRRVRLGGLRRRVLGTRTSRPGPAQHGMPGGHQGGDHPAYPCRTPTLTTSPGGAPSAAAQADRAPSRRAR